MAIHTSAMCARNVRTRSREVALGASHLAVEHRQSTSVSTIVFRLMARIDRMPLAVSIVVLKMEMTRSLENSNHTASSTAELSGSANLA
jgi:hypothetical protein